MWCVWNIVHHLIHLLRENIDNVTTCFCIDMFFNKSLKSCQHYLENIIRNTSIGLLLMWGLSCYSHWNILNDHPTIVGVVFFVNHLCNLSDPTCLLPFSFLVKCSNIALFIIVDSAFMRLLCILSNFLCPGGRWANRRNENELNGTQCWRLSGYQWIGSNYELSTLQSIKNRENTVTIMGGIMIILFPMWYILLWMGPYIVSVWIV